MVKWLPVCVILTFSTIADSSRPWKTLDYGPLDLPDNVGRLFLFDHEKSQKPSTIFLFETGKIAGRWRSSQHADLLAIQTQPLSARNNLSLDIHIVSETALSPIRIAVSDSAFIAFGMDITGNGQDELILQYRSRDQGDRRLHLLILQWLDDRFEPLISLPVSGYVRAHHTRVPDAATRYVIRYAMMNTDSTPALELVTVLQAPKNADVSDGDPDYSDAFLFPVKCFHYDAMSRRLYLKDAVYRPFSAYDVDPLDTTAGQLAD